MPDFMYTNALKYGPDAIAAMDLRMLIVMTNTTADDDEDAEFLSEITTLDEYNGSGYARVALANEASSVIEASDRGKLTSDPAVFAALGAGTRNGQAVIIYQHVGADSANKPIFYKEPTGFPFTGNGEDVTINPHADGWAYARNAV